MSVENRDGQRLGKVDDFIVSCESGKLSFVVVSCGGWLGIGKKLKVVPSQLLSTATAKVGVVALDVGRRRWDRAPLFKRSDLLEFNRDPSAAEGLCRYYSASARSSHDIVSASPSQSRLSPTGRGTFEFGSGLLGEKVVDDNGQILGQLSDLLVDSTDQRPTLGILTAGKELKQTSSFALALCQATFQPGGALRIEANPRSFDRAPVLDDNIWQPALGRQPIPIYRFPSGRAGDTPYNHILFGARFFAN